MSSFEQANGKEKVLRNISILLRPLIWLRTRLGRGDKLRSTRKRQILASIMCLALVFTILPFDSFLVEAKPAQWNGSAASSFSGGGEGTKANPYKIATAWELKLFANIVNGTNLEDTDFEQNTAACCELLADITLNTGSLNDYDGTAANSWVQWAPIGQNDIVYVGTFNGNNHIVSGLYYKSSRSQVGFFGHIGAGSSITNLGVENSYISGVTFVGGVWL